MKMYAPVVLFVYNRPEHTQKTVEALKQNIGAENTELYIFCDYAKNDQAKEAVHRTREYVRTITGFGAVHIIEREENWGLAKSIIAGVSEVVNRHGRVIVLEDDIRTGRYFLSYMNTALEKYKDEKQVFSVTGYSHFPNGNKKLPPSYFLKVFSSWSWATWADRWELFDADALGWEKVKEDKELRKAFDYENCFYNSHMLKQQMEDHTIDSWAIRAYWTMFCQDAMTLFPNVRLCENQGFDGSGVHCNTEGDYLTGILSEQEISSFPEKIEELPITRHELIRYIRHKKALYKCGRLRHYLRHPKDAIDKVKGKRK